MRIAFIPLVLLLFGLAACQGKPFGGASPAGMAGKGADAHTLTAKAAAMESRLSSFHPMEGYWREGHAASRFTAYFSSGEIKVIEERLGVGGYGASVNRYYFESGGLFHYWGNGLVRVMTPEGGPDVQTIEISLSLDPKGRVVQGWKVVDTEEADLGDKEIRAITGHARALKGLAERETRAEAPARPVLERHPVAPLERQHLARLGG